MYEFNCPSCSKVTFRHDEVWSMYRASFLGRTAGHFRTCRFCGSPVCVETPTSTRVAGCLLVLVMAIPVTFLAAYFLIFTLPYLLMSAANPATVAAGRDLASKETWMLVLASIPLALLALFPVTVMIARLLFRKASLRSADLTSWNQR